MTDIADTYDELKNPDAKPRLNKKGNKRGTRKNIDKMNHPDYIINPKTGNPVKRKSRQGKRILRDMQRKLKELEDKVEAKDKENQEEKSKDTPEKEPAPVDAPAVESAEPVAEPVTKPAAEPVKPAKSDKLKQAQLMYQKLKNASPEVQKEAVAKLKERAKGANLDAGHQLELKLGDPTARKVRKMFHKVAIKRIMKGIDYATARDKWIDANGMPKGPDLQEENQELLDQYGADLRIRRLKARNKKEVVAENVELSVLIDHIQHDSGSGAPKANSLGAIIDVQHLGLNVGQLRNLLEGKGVAQPPSVGLTSGKSVNQKIAPVANRPSYNVQKGGGLNVEKGWRRNNKGGAEERTNKLIVGVKGDLRSTGSGRQEIRL